MTLLILMPGKENSELLKALKTLNPNLDIRIWPEVGDVNDISFAIVWNHPKGELKNYPNLKVIASFGAGVDHIFKDPDLPKNIAITKLVDDSLSGQMCEYVAGVILNQRLRLTEYREYQAASVWAPKAFKSGNNVSLLGLGHIGKEVAEYLVQLNFKVSGWSQSKKDIKNVTTFYGQSALKQAVHDADYIVCLLPLTPKTENILNKSLFSMAKKGAYLINAGRGGQLNEDDLLDALSEEKLSGACLDVFKVEPLPKEHPFWCHPKIYITPHSASMTNIKKAASQFYDNYLNMKNGETLFHQIDPDREY
ncbi:MAG: glyoxylate/hydroxypyruvate reductase A [Emcibacter sp.]|nr:glyoxylate/hydroxypyruvate reductase A [Emcibacter sp.]